MPTLEEHRSEFAKLDAGRLLPGCSLPINLEGPAGERSSRHAFAQFEPLPLDGLNRTAKQSLTDSMIDVVSALRQMHTKHVCCGHISSTAFHNRGTIANPSATLWLDPSHHSQCGDVHVGDPESMYWTEARLKSGAAATPADDWYALGIVLAEVALSSEAVHKIWELSRQDGDFVGSLVKNLKRCRAGRRLKSMAITLIKQGSAGAVDSGVLDQFTRRKSNSKPVLAIAVVTALLAISYSAYSHWQVRRLSQQHAAAMTPLKDEISRLENEADRLRQLARQPRAEDPLVVEPVRVPAGNLDRSIWKEKISGQSLEAALELTGLVDQESWWAPLRAIQATPGQSQWRSQDIKLRRLVQQAIDSPWNPETANEAVGRLAALGEAHARWLTWARSQRSVDEIRTQHDLLPPGMEKDLLGKWLAEALDVHNFRLAVVAKGPDDTQGWTSHLVGFETPRESKSVSWQWDVSSEQSPRVVLDVSNYVLGDTLSFWLQRDSSIPFWNSTVIEHDFRSPLLVWMLARGLKLSDSESGYVLLVSTDHKCGPPVVLETSGEVSATVLDRKVVDPVDSLPFDVR